MALTHYVQTKSGDVYTGRDGSEKESYVTIGRMLETARGAKVIILDCIPFAWLGAGKPVVLFLQDPNRDKTAAPVAAAAAAPPRSASLDDDIPF